MLSTSEGRKKVPYTQINVSFDGMSPEELKGKRVKVIIFEDGTVELTKPKDE